MIDLDAKIAEANIIVLISNISYYKFLELIKLHNDDIEMDI
jgi:hypothetical protein